MKIAEKHHLCELISILESAFQDIDLDNSINYVIKQDRNRASRLRFLMQYLAKTALIKGRAYISDSGSACLLVYFPKKYSIKDRLKLLLLNLQLAVKTIGVERVHKVLKRQYHLNRYHPEIDHFHPIIMGVKKEVNGRGSGIRLAYEVLRHEEPLKYPIVIETTTEKNIAFYQSIGFKIIARTEDLEYPLTYLQYPG